MKIRKPHISRWYALGLAALLLTGCLLASAGVAWARYRSEEEKPFYFLVSEPASIYLGKMVSTGEGLPAAFDTTAEIGWETGDGQQMLNFAVSNGASASSFENRDQTFSIRLVSSLGVSDGGEAPTIKLSFTGEGGTAVEITATATRISAGTPLYTTFGDGWVYDFQENGQELSWTLKGGTLSCVDMTVAIASDSAIDTSLVQLQIAATVVKD